MSIPLHSEIDALRENLEAYRAPEYALKMSAYMKGHFPFLGIRQPERKRLSHTFIKTIKQHYAILPRDILWTLWQMPEREYQYIALDLLNKYLNRLTPSHQNFVEQLITEKSWWDSVDALATNAMASIMQKIPDSPRQSAYTWIESGNLWLHRTAIIFQLKYKEQTDWELLTDVILLSYESEEFFIQKAMGWALREYAKRQPGRVLEFVERTPLPALSRREALKHIKH